MHWDASMYGERTSAEHNHALTNYTLTLVLLMLYTYLNVVLDSIERSRMVRRQTCIETDENSVSIASVPADVRVQQESVCLYRVSRQNYLECDRLHIGEEYTSLCVYVTLLRHYSMMIYYHFNPHLHVNSIYTSHCVSNSG